MNPASNKAADLLAAAPLKFTPLDDFFSEEFKSAYCKGQKYTLHASDAPYWDVIKANHKTEEAWRAAIEELRQKLATCMEAWLEAGQIRFLDPREGLGPTASASVAGTGVVT